MRLWNRASGALKDKTSLWQANLTHPSPLRNPDLEKAVIRATSHDPSSLPRHHADHLRHSLRQSPANLKPILWSFSNRLEKTRSWVVAVKGLYLLHALINTGAPSVATIGRLPFDLSAFSDAHLRRSHAWPFDTFVRAYYAFLDHKSTIAFQHADNLKKHGEDKMSMMNELVLLQSLVDLLIQVKPVARAVYAPLILHVMDAVIVEVYDVYSRICRGIAVVITNIYSAGKAEATVALQIVRKATRQGEEVLHYLEFCQEIGVVNASEFPVVDRVPDEGIDELERIVRSFERKAIVVEDDKKNEGEIKNVYRGDEFRTIITDKWEKFEDDFNVGNIHAQGNKYEELPDLMTF